MSNNISHISNNDNNISCQKPEENANVAMYKVNSSFYRGYELTLKRGIRAHMTITAKLQTVQISLGLNLGLKIVCISKEV